VQIDQGERLDHGSGRSALPPARWLQGRSCKLHDVSMDLFRLANFALARQPL